MKKKWIRASVEWTPRSGNREADALANGDVSNFGTAPRMHVEPRGLQWQVLPQALARGREAERVSRAAKGERGVFQRETSVSDGEGRKVITGGLMWRNTRKLLYRHRHAHVWRGFRL